MLLPAVTNAQGLAGLALLVTAPLSIILFFVLLPIAIGIQNLAGMLKIQPSIKIDFIFALIIYLPLTYFSGIFYNDISLWHERVLFVLPPLLVIIPVFFVAIIIFFLKKSIPHTIIISGLVFLWIIIGGFLLITLERVDEKIMNCSISTGGQSISQCLYNIAAKNKDEKICDLIKKISLKWGESSVSYDSCIFSIAGKKEDPQICDLLSEDSNKQYCINAVKIQKSL